MIDFSGVIKKANESLKGAPFHFYNIIHLFQSDRFLWSLLSLHFLFPCPELKTMEPFFRRAPKHPFEPPTDLQQGSTRLEFLLDQKK